jgi:colanic acid biosynthesis protein WcaH
VDLLIRKGNKVLLVRRENEPLKGYWWVPGGRILKGESAVDAAKRKAATEVGMRIDPKFAGVYEGKFETGAHGVPVHTVSLVYEAKAPNERVRLDSQSSDWKWGDVPKGFRDSFSEA